MLASLFRTLGLTPDDERHHETETVGELAQALSGQPPERARLLAAFAYLLGRVAFADHEVTVDEREAMKRQIGEAAGVDGDEASHLVELALRATASHGAAEDYQVAREFETLATREEKLDLLRALFVVSAQHGITTVEDNEISRIASVLRLERSDVVALRHEFRDSLLSRK